MNVDSSSMRRDPFASNNDARNAPDTSRPAFEQVLRVMEKNMWPGAKAGRMTGDQLPGQTRPGASTSFGGLSAFDADAETTARNDSVANAGKSNAIAASSSSVRCRELRSPATMAAQRSANVLAQPDIESHVIEFKALSQLATVQNRTALPEDRSMPQLLSPALQTAITPSPISPAAMPMNRESASAPYRLTIMNGAAGVSIALRVSAAHADDVETLTQNALDELDSHGARGVRLIVNGVEYIPTSSRGIPHGY